MEEAQEVPISISHDGEYATAMALGFTNSDGSISRVIAPPAKVTKSKLSIFEANHYPVSVTNLKPGIDADFVLNLFKLRCSRVRCAKIEGTHTINGKGPFSNATVSFPYEIDAKNAVAALHNFKILDHKIQVRPMTSLWGKFEPEGPGWIWNEDFEKQRKIQEKKELRIKELKESKLAKQSEAKEVLSWERRMLRTETLAPEVSVFQDDPTVYLPTRREEPQQMENSFMSREISRSNNWDSVTGGKLRQDELMELVMIEETKRVAANKRRNMRFAVPENRRGFFIHE